MKKIITIAKLREQKQRLDKKLKEKQMTRNEIREYHELLTILERVPETMELVTLEYLMSRNQEPKRKHLNEFETYKELCKYGYSLDYRLRNGQINKADIYDYHKIMTVSDIMQKIRNELNDSYWLAILKNLMEEHTNREYKVVQENRHTSSKRGNELKDVVLSYPYIVPKEFNEKDLTDRDIIDAGEIARTYFDRGIVAYFNNNCQVGLPLEVIEKYDEFVFDIFKTNYKEKNSTIKKRRFH